MSDTPLPPTVPNQIQRILRAFEFYSYTDIKIKKIRNATIVSAKGITGQASVIVHYGSRASIPSTADCVIVSKSRGIYLEFRCFSYYLLENAT